MPYAYFVLAFALTGCSIDEPPARIMQRTYTPVELQQRICHEHAKSCATIGGVIWFLEQGYVFTYDDRGAKHYRHAERAVEIVEYKSKPFVLNADGAVLTFGLGWGGGDEWFVVTSSVKDIAAYCDDLLALGIERGELKRLVGDTGAVKWSLGPRHYKTTATCGTDCVAPATGVEYVPRANGKDLSFVATPFVGVKEMKATGETLELTGFDGIKRIVAQSEYPSPPSKR